jgi:hypothetical protein
MDKPHFDKEAMVTALVNRHMAVTPPHTLLELHAKTVFISMMRAPDEKIIELYNELQSAPPVHYDA